MQLQLTGIVSIQKTGKKSMMNWLQYWIIIELKMNINHQNNTSMKYFQFSTNIAVWIGIEFNLNYLPCAVFDWNAITMNVEWIFDDRNRSEPIIQKTLCKKTKKNIKCKCGIHLFINEFFYDSFTWSWQYYWESTAKLFFLLYIYIYFFLLLNLIWPMWGCGGFVFWKLWRIGDDWCPAGRWVRHPPGRYRRTPTGNPRE